MLSSIWQSQNGQKGGREQVKHIMEAWKCATNAINGKAGKVPPAQYRVRDQVWLEGLHLKLPHQLTKLAPKWYGPFNVEKEINLMTYQLTLPTTWQIHLVFHASLLSPYHETEVHELNYSRPPPDLINGEEFFKVEQIQDHWCHGQAKMLQYLIKWKGSPESNNTWEPADLVLALDLLKEYHKHWPLLGIKANCTTLQYPCCQHWIPQSHHPSSALSSDLHHTPPTNFMSLNHVFACRKISLAPSPITATCTSPTSMYLNWHGGLLGHLCLLIFLPFISIFPTLWLESSSLPLYYFTYPPIHFSPVP